MEKWQNCDTIMANGVNEKVFAHIENAFIQRQPVDSSRNLNITNNYFLPAYFNLTDWVFGLILLL